tara:strand:+ start:34 stop:858 length:825 start_codon:yes stop_codon:yes gene_type:complete
MLVCAMGMPRSGTTLQYNIARLLAELTGFGYGHMAMEIMTPDESREHGRELEKSAYVDDEGLWIHSVTNVHGQFTKPGDIARLGEAGKLRLFYTTRDLRAVAVSMMDAHLLSWEDTVEGLKRAHESYEVVAPLLDSVPWAMQVGYWMYTADRSSGIHRMSDFLGIPTDGALENQIATATCPSKILMRPKRYLTENETWPVTDSQERAGRRTVTKNWGVRRRWIAVDGESRLSGEQSELLTTMCDGWNSKLTSTDEPVQEPVVQVPAPRIVPGTA